MCRRHFASTVFTPSVQYSYVQACGRLYKVPMAFLQSCFIVNGLNWAAALCWMNACAQRTSGTPHHSHLAKTASPQATAPTVLGLKRNLLMD